MKIQKIKDKIEDIQITLNMIKYTIPKIIEMWKIIYKEYIKQKEKIKEKTETTIKGIEAVQEIKNV